MTTWGLVFFYLCAALAIGGALVTIIAKNPIRCAMGLMGTILAVAGIFMALHAQFLAAIQLVVYAGAINVLFIFVIMLLGPSAQPARDHRGRVVRALGGSIFGLAAAGAMYLVAKPMWNQAQTVRSPGIEYGSIDAIGKSLFNDGIVPFELSSALLLVAIVGAVAVARGNKSFTAGDKKPAGAPAAVEVE
jgi:NADH-quinone oxidoreductase subunit J